MSTTIDNSMMTIPQQSAAATRELCMALGLGAVKPADLKFLTLALARVATDEATHNCGFAERVRSHYQSLLPSRQVRTKTPAKTADEKPKRNNRAEVKLIPIGTVDESELDSYAPPNPWALQRLYGNDQLALALERYSLGKLEQALPAVQERYPGTKPRRKTKPAIVEYIVGQLVTSHP